MASAKQPLSQLKDEELIKNLKKRLQKKNVIQLNEYFSDPGTDAYFQEIYNRYKQPLEYYCSRFIHDPEMKSDLFHDIFIKIYLNIHKYHYNKSFKAWVYRIAHNSCINYKRKGRDKEKFILNKKVGTPDGNKDTELIDLFANPDTDLEQKMINREIKDIIDNAVRELPYDYANVFLLKSEGGLTFEEIARILKISSRSVKSFYKNAAIFIKEKLVNNNINLNDI
ncbi:MAG TPA: RNA polymerase sigma factor [Spirochaetota bacterium]|nr:RNA polymerase sigma factor [Spirochaetota bacterium]